MPYEPDIATFLTLEQMLQRPEVRKSRTAIEALLASDFREFGSSGRTYDRTIVIDALIDASSTADALPEMRDFTAKALAPNIVLVTYRSKRDAPGANSVLRSSIWREADGAWQMIFHQGTVAAL